MEQEEVPVWVGVLDERIDERSINKSKRRAFSSKVGGRPVWFAEDESLQREVQQDPNLVLPSTPTAADLTCQVCGSPLYLVVQTYAPTMDLDRVIYVFGCNNSDCQNKQGSWVALRGQIPIKDPDGQSNSSTSSGDDGDQDDVDEEEDEEINGEAHEEDEEINGEAHEEKKQSSSASQPSPFEECNEWGDGEDDQQLAHEFQNKVVLSSSSASTPVSGTLSPNKSNGKKKSRSKGKQTVARKLTSTTTAQPPPPYCLPAFVLSIFEEPSPPPADERKDLELLRRFNPMLPSEEEEEEDSGYGADAGGDSSSDLLPQIQEDKVFSKFSKTLKRCPEQAVRWAFGGQPLWISEPDRKALSRIPRCERCGADRIFEMQILSTIIYLLKPHLHSHIEDDDGMDFGTVAVFSCSASCDPRRSPDSPAEYARECIHIQAAI